MLQHLLEGLPVVVSDRATSSAEAREYLRCGSRLGRCSWSDKMARPFQLSRWWSAGS